MTTNKLDELIEDYTIELRNSIGSLLPTPHPDDFKQAIEAYIAEQIIEKLEHLATSDPRYTHAALKDELAELKSNERGK